MRLIRSLFIAVAFSGALLLATPVDALDLTPGGSFIDDDGSTFEPSIEAMYAAGITVGCTPRQQFCPQRDVTRGEMAAFLSRALSLPTATVDYFTDDGQSIFESDINKIAELGVTNGCNPPDNTRFCPDAIVTREQMAAFLVRAFSLPNATVTDRFGDDDESLFEHEIDSLAEAGVTYGCNPPDNTSYCPKDPVTRGAMAAFLTRAIPLDPITPPPRPPTHLVASFTTHHSCCQARVHNIQTMARALDGWIILPWEVFDLNEVVGPRTEAKGYVPAPILLDGESYCCDHPANIGGGTSQFATTIFNTIFWGAYDDISHTPHSRYISRYPLGIEATLGYPWPNVVFVNDTWTPVVIRTSYASTSITVELWGNNGGRTLVGEHRSGKTIITVVDAGGPDARQVTATVLGSATWDDGGFVRVTRTVDGPDGTTVDTWSHYYSGSGE